MRATPFTRKTKQNYKFSKFTNKWILDLLGLVCIYVMYVIRQFIYSGVSDKSLRSRFTEVTENINNTCQSYVVLIKKSLQLFFLKMAKEPADVIEVGRLFHKRGPATAKDRSRRQSLTEAQAGDRNRLTVGVGWQLQTMVDGCSPQRNWPSCREHTYTSWRPS